jgi:hypothetical protein
MNIYHVLICGSRNFVNSTSIEREIVKVLNTNEKICVVHGACRGADLTADAVCKKLMSESNKRKILPSKLVCWIKSRT